MQLSHRPETYPSRQVCGFVVFRSPSRRLPEFFLYKQLANSSGTICKKWPWGFPIKLLTKSQGTTKLKPQRVK